MSNKNWIKRRLNDFYLKQAHKENYRSRAVYKLKEIIEKYNILRKNFKVLDLGCAPGSWCQYIRQNLNEKGLIVGVDIQNVEPIDGVIIINGDFTDAKIQEQVLSMAIEGYDLILSDMAPNTTGIRDADSYRSFELVNLVLDLCPKLLKRGGSLIAKVFEGAEYKLLQNKAKTMFEFVKTSTPAASLSRSREVYLVAINFKKS